jgi:hypothetical protein
MIGGHDWFGELSGVESSDVDLLLRSLVATWPLAVVERDGDSPQCVPLREALKWAWAVPCEFYVYETKQACEDWNDEGLTPENADKMIYVQVERDGFACVVSADGSSSKKAVEDAVGMIRVNRRIFPDRIAA